jgi:hypothetical protein
MTPVARFLGMPIEIEWALDEEGFMLLVSRPLEVAPRAQAPVDGVAVILRWLR